MKSQHFGSFLWEDELVKFWIRMITLLLRINANELNFDHELLIEFCLLMTIIFISYLVYNRVCLYNGGDWKMWCV